MSEKELLESILAADVAILARLIQIKKQMDGITSSPSPHDAAREIKKQRKELIQLLTSVD